MDHAGISLKVISMSTLRQIITRSILAAFILSPLLVAQQTAQITNSEPGIYQLSDLFKRADHVVLAKIVSGDIENYDVAVYKAEVLKSFKGVTTGQVIYFGPYGGEELGSEYVLFLRDLSKHITPKKTAAAGYGTIPYLEVFNEGYTSMISSYDCVFDGKEIAQQCDYGVRVCTDYIKLPKSTPAFPLLDENKKDPPFGCRWVRKTLFTTLLDAFAKSSK
jgi:hypothetical protein